MSCHRAAVSSELGYYKTTSFGGGQGDPYPGNRMGICMSFCRQRLDGGDYYYYWSCQWGFTRCDGRRLDGRGGGGRVEFNQMISRS